MLISKLFFSITEKIVFNRCQCLSESRPIYNKFSVLHCSSNYISESIVINRNCRKTCTIKDLVYTVNSYLKILSNYTCLKACTILREFSDITLSVNPWYPHIQWLNLAYKFVMVFLGLFSGTSTWWVYCHHLLYL